MKIMKKQITILMLFAALAFSLNAQKNMLYIRGGAAAGSAMNAYDSAIHVILKAAGYNIKDTFSKETALPTAGFDVVFFSESAGSGDACWAQYKDAPLPMVANKVHAVKGTALNWTAQAPANNATYNNTKATKLKAYPDGKTHPIFNNFADKDINVFDTSATSLAKVGYTSAPGALLTWCWIDPAEMTGGKILSTLPDILVVAGLGEGKEVQNIIAFEPNAVVNANTLKNRAVMLGLHSAGFLVLSDEGKRLILQCIEWAETGDVVSISNTAAAPSFSIFPNPASGLATVTFNKNISSNVVLSNLTGQKVAEFAPQGNQVTFETSNFAAGVYFVTVDNVSAKLIIK
jgi:hypothetical protein